MRCSQYLQRTILFRLQHASNREVALLSKLTHRRLPRIYDHFTDPEHWYLVMDYIEGQTLEAYVQAMPGKALPIKKVITIGIQVCDVLNFLPQGCATR